MNNYILSNNPNVVSIPEENTSEKNSKITNVFNII